MLASMHGLLLCIIVISLHLLISGTVHLLRRLVHSLLLLLMVALPLVSSIILGG